MAVEILSNINDVKKTDRKIYYSQKPVIKVITNGFFIVDDTWEVKYWNNGAEKLLGITADEILGKNLWKKFKGDIPLHFYEAYHNASLQTIPANFKEQWYKSATWFEVHTYYLDNTLSFSFKSSGHPEYPEYPEYSKPQLKILNKLYQFVTEVTNDCLWEWNLQTKEIFWIDGGHRRLFGYQIENALIPQSFWESRIHPDDRVRILFRLNKIINEGFSCLWEEEYRFTKASGDYSYVHDRGHIIYDEDSGARMIGATQDITARKLSENKLIEERLTRQKEITDAVLAAHENERSDIGKELHDNLNQILGAAKLYIEMAKKNGDNRAMCLEKSSGYIVEVIDEIRKISKSLAIPALHLMGLVDHIKILIDDLTIVQPIKIEFHQKDIDENYLNEKLQLNIYRIVQEQLNNILKHANATHAAVDLTQEVTEIILIISDNGVGCNILESIKGMGIRNIMSRAELYSGSATVDSKPGEGYRLRVVLPLHNQMDKLK